jgi:RNA polymerase sigma-70 factor (ECF subfamily)
VVWITKIAGLRRWIHEGVKHARACEATRIPEDKVRLQTTTCSAAHSRFVRLVVPQMDAAYNLARYLSRDADAAQDIAQTAILKAHRHFDQYRGGDAKAWLLVIVRNCFHDWLQEQRRNQKYKSDFTQEGDGDDAAHVAGSDVASLDDTPEVALIRKSEAERVREVLNQLPRISREVLVLRELEGLSYKEISGVVAVPIGTVMSRLARARREFCAAWLMANSACQEPAS